MLQIAFQYIPCMMTSHDWRVHYTALMAVAAVGEGGARVMQKEVGKVVQQVTGLTLSREQRYILQIQ